MTLLSIIDAASLFQWVVDNSSYLMVFLLMTVESSFIPFPSEIVVPPAAYLACTTDNMNIYVVVLVATAGAICGALINYYLALWVGRPLVYKFADSRFAHACLIDRAKVDKADSFFVKHGAISTFIGRLVPVVRQLISVPAGIARMNIVKFIIYTGLGAMIWNIALAALGYWLSETVALKDLYTQVEYYNDYLTYAGFAIGVAALAFMLWNAFKPRKNNNEPIKP